jgi:hypothetical protein
MTKSKLITLLVLPALLFIGSGSANAAGSMPPGWQQTWLSFGVDPYVAESVVWPEYEHYDSFRNFFETTLVYVAGATSSDWPDMSIGIFQMKPSFVEALEKNWQESGLRGPCELDFDTSGTLKAYRDRVSRLHGQEWPVIYLAMFLRSLYSSYGSFDRDGNRVQDGIDSLPMEEQVRLAANAYNRGCEWFEAGRGDPDLLRVRIDKETFPRVLIPSPGRRQHSYAALAWEHFRSLSEDELH